MENVTLDKCTKKIQEEFYYIAQKNILKKTNKEYIYIEELGNFNQLLKDSKILIIA